MYIQPWKRVKNIKRRRKTKSSQIPNFPIRSKTTRSNAWEQIKCFFCFELKATITNSGMSHYIIPRIIIIIKFIFLGVTKVGGGGGNCHPENAIRYVRVSVRLNESFLNVGVIFLYPAKVDNLLFVG